MIPLILNWAAPSGQSPEGAAAPLQTPDGGFGAMFDLAAEGGSDGVLVELTAEVSPDIAPPFGAEITAEILAESGGLIPALSPAIPLPALGPQMAQHPLGGAEISTELVQQLPVLAQGQGGAIAQTVEFDTTMAGDSVPPGMAKPDVQQVPQAPIAAQKIDQMAPATAAILAQADPPAVAPAAPILARAALPRDAAMGQSDLTGESAQDLAPDMAPILTVSRPVSAASLAQAVIQSQIDTDSPQPELVTSPKVGVPPAPPQTPTPQTPPLQTATLHPPAPTATVPPALVAEAKPRVRANTDAPPYDGDMAPDQPALPPQAAPLLAPQVLAVALNPPPFADPQAAPLAIDAAPNAATPLAPNGPAAAQQPPSLAAQIIPHATKSGPVEILLNPAELGHVRFEIHQKGDHVQVILSAERPETLDLLRRNTDQLTAEFRDSGFAGSNLSFGQWGRNDRPPPANLIDNFTTDSGGEFLAPPPAPRDPPRDPSRNLNLRL